MNLLASGSDAPRSPRDVDRHGIARWLVIVPLAAAVLVFAPVLRNGLGYDEFMHIYNLVNFGAAELLLTPHSGHLLYLGNLVYAPLYELFGMTPRAYLATALSTHLLNVALCYRVLLRFTERPAVAMLATTVWGCAALHAASIGRFAVYGHLLLGTIVLLLLARLSDRDGAPTRSVVVETLLLVAAAGSFGYGLAVATLWPAVRLYVSDDHPSAFRLGSRLVVSTMGVGLLYVGVHVVHHAISGRRPFGGSGIFGVAANPSAGDAIFFGRAILDRMGCGIVNTFIGPTPSFVMLPGAQPPGIIPPATAFVFFRIACVAWIIACVYCGLRRTTFARRLAFALGILAFACYAMVSASRTVRFTPGSTEDLFGIPTRMVMAGRYHYLPTLGFIVATTPLLPSLPDRRRSRRRVFLVIAVIWTALVVAVDFTTVHAMRPGWDFQAIVEGWLRKSVRDFPPQSTVYVDNGNVPIPFAVRNQTLPGRAAMALTVFPDGVVDGRRVLFVEYDRDLLRQLRERMDTPIARLVVAPEEVPPDAQYVPTLPRRVSPGDGPGRRRARILDHEGRRPLAGVH
jgi:hypothetical protein